MEITVPIVRASLSAASFPGEDRQELISRRCAPLGKTCRDEPSRADDAAFRMSGSSSEATSRSRGEALHGWTMRAASVTVRTPEADLPLQL